MGRRFQMGVLAACLGSLALGVYLGWFDLSLPEEEIATPPPEAQPSTESAVMTAMFGYILGPLLLCFGYKVPELVVVFNSLITCGVGSYIETLTYISQLNKQISHGKALPQQAIDFFQVKEPVASTRPLIPP
jgi:hypothetical protein